MHLPLKLSSRHRGMSWAPVVFLLAFLIALAVIALFLVAPLAEIASSGPREQQLKVKAFLTLLFSILIAVLLIGLVFTLRIGRTSRKADEPRKPTVYPDAWQESARRLETPSAEDLEPDPPEDRPNP